MQAYGCFASSLQRNAVNYTKLSLRLALSLTQKRSQETRQRHPGFFSLLSQPSSHATVEEGPGSWSSSPTKPASSAQTPRPPLKKKKRKKETIPMDYSKQEALSSSLENRKCLQRSEAFLVAAPFMQGLCPQPAAVDNLEAEPPQPPALRVWDPWCHS